MVGENEKGNGKENISVMPSSGEIEDCLRDLTARYSGEELIARLHEFVKLTINEALFAVQSVKATPKNLEATLGAISCIEGVAPPKKGSSPEL